MYSLVSEAAATVILCLIVLPHMHAVHAFHHPTLALGGGALDLPQRAIGLSRQAGPPGRAASAAKGLRGGGQCFLGGPRSGGPPREVPLPRGDDAFLGGSRRRWPR